MSIDSETNGNNTSTFLLKEGNVSFNSQSVRFLNNGAEEYYDAVGVSSDKSLVSILSWNGEEGEILLYDSEGNKLFDFESIMLADEASFGMYTLGNGNTILRDKIANFTFYDTFGEITTSVSNSSQSKGGEAISEVAINESGKTVVLYNPQIKRDGTLGSKAQVRTGVEEFKDIYFSSDRYLKDVTVSDDGSFIALITARDGTSDQVLIMDKYGNELNTISADEDLKGINFTNNLEQVTIYSGGRVMVHNTLTGESLGATSLRSPVIVADYFPEDNLILALTGNYSDQSGLLNSVNFRAINLEQRSIASQQLSGALGMSDIIDVEFKRNASNNFMLEGANKRVNIRANF
ncbi:hypothetical protein [Fodinibius sp. Rm-B-1B1-1]|uniref:hypothetical protein n=1 Tax=Fodinibius alkaliphilus TaxID=3140241 RepID=UPI00315A626F